MRGVFGFPRQKVIFMLMRGSYFLAGLIYLWCILPSSRHLNFHTVPLKLNDFKTIRACRKFLHMLCYASRARAFAPPCPPFLFSFLLVFYTWIHLISLLQEDFWSWRGGAGEISPGRSGVELSGRQQCFNTNVAWGFENFLKRNMGNEGSRAVIAFQFWGRNLRI